MLLIRRQPWRTCVNYVFPSTKLTMRASLSRWQGCTACRSMTRPTSRSLCDVHFRLRRSINAYFMRRPPSESRFSDDRFHPQPVNSILVTESNRSLRGTVTRLLSESPTPSATVSSPVADGPYPLTRNCTDHPDRCNYHPGCAFPKAARNPRMGRMPDPVPGCCDHPAGPASRPAVSEPLGMGPHIGSAGHRSGHPFPPPSQTINPYPNQAVSGGHGRHDHCRQTRLVSEQFLVQLDEIGAAIRIGASLMAAPVPYHCRYGSVYGCLTG